MNLNCAWLNKTRLNVKDSFYKQQKKWTNESQISSSQSEQFTILMRQNNESVSLRGRDSNEENKDRFQ